MCPQHRWIEPYLHTTENKTTTFLMRGRKIYIYEKDKYIYEEYSVKKYIFEKYKVKKYIYK